MKTTSYWLDRVAFPKFSRLTRPMTVDVVVIGAGITGVTAAHLLKKAGHTVALIDRGRIGGVDSTATTAHLTCVTDQSLTMLVKNFGKEHARAVWDVGYAAIDRIVSTIREEEIDCEFTWGPAYQHIPVVGKSTDNLDELKKEALVAGRLGFAAEFLDEVPSLGVPGVRYEHQARFHPQKYLAGLVRRIPGQGSVVCDHTEATAFHDDPLSVVANGHRLTCKDIVIATHSPLTGIAGVASTALLQTKLYLYSSYVLGARVPSGKLPPASYWDTSDPYYYLRVDRKRGYDYAIFGGEDHKTGQETSTTDAFKRLERAFRKYYPAAPIDHRWSGQVIETNDGLPFIGELVEHQFIATGFAGNGMTFGTLAGMMAVDAIDRRKNPWQELFAPSRKKLKGGALRYLKENIDYPYYLVRDRLAKAESTSVRSVARGQGKVVNLNGKKVAAYRSEEGKVTLLSPVCTHLGCIVNWNTAGRTWDCPCHGSRFKGTGEVLAGPAESPLPHADE